MPRPALPRPPSRAWPAWPPARRSCTCTCPTSSCPRRRRPRNICSASSRGWPSIPTCWRCPPTAGGHARGALRASVAARRGGCPAAWRSSTPARPSSAGPARTAPRPPTATSMPSTTTRCRTRSMRPSTAGIGMHFAIFEPGWLRNVLAYWRAGRLPAGSFVKFYFGGPYGVLARGPGVTFGLPPTLTGAGRLPRDARAGGLRAAVVLGGGRRRSARDAGRPGHPRAGWPPAGRARGPRR